MKYPFFCLLFCALAFACDAPKKAVTHARPAPAPGQPAPPPAVPVSAAATNIAWLDSERLMPVLEMAQRDKKPVFVSFHASWCAPCKVMEEEIFTQQPVFDFLNRHFLNFRADFDAPAGRTIAEIYEVAKIPTVLFLNPQGVVLERYTGIASASTLNSLGNAALQKMGN